jgi:hypothetical protein
MRYAFDIIGKIREPDENNPGQFITVVYQNAPDFALNYTMPSGKRVQRRILKLSATPPKPSELSRRAHMSAACAAWRAAPESVRQLYAEDAKQRSIMIHNAFISAWLLANPPPPLATTLVAAYTKQSPHTVIKPGSIIVIKIT